MPCGVLIRDPTGRILQANAAVQEMLGLTAERLLGLTGLPGVRVERADGGEIPESDLPNAVVRRTGQPDRGVEALIVRSDGSRRTLHLDAVPALDDKGEIALIVCSFTDITALKQATLRLEESARQIQAIVDLGQEAIAGAPLQQLFDRAVRAVQSMLSIDHVKICELLPDGQHLIVRAGIGWREGVVGQMILPIEGTQCGISIRAGTPVVVSDLPTDRRCENASMLREHGILSGASVIIDSVVGPFGTIDAHATWRREFTADDISFLQAVANVLAGGHRRAGEGQRLQERVRLRGRLSCRELEVLQLLTDGASNHEIASHLGLGYTTVRAHVRTIIDKLEVHSRLEAVARAGAHDLLGLLALIASIDPLVLEALKAS